MYGFVFYSALSNPLERSLLDYWDQTGMEGTNHQDILHHLDKLVDRYQCRNYYLRLQKGLSAGIKQTSLSESILEGSFP